MMSSAVLYRALPAFLALALLAPDSDAANISWAGPVSGNWSDSANWSPAQVPGPGDSALIQVAGTYTVTLDQDATVDLLSLGSGSAGVSLVISGQNLSLTSGLSSITAGATLDLSSGAQIDGTGTLSNGGSIDLDASTIAINVANNASLDSDGASAIDGILTTGTSSLIRVFSGALTIDQGFTNNNQVQLLGAGSQLAVTNGSLTNATGKVILASGVAPARTLAAQIVNNGTITVAAPLDVVRADAAHQNNGTINCFLGPLQILQSGTSPSFDNAGTLFTSPTRIISIDAGTVDNLGTGIIRGSGVFDVTGATFTNSGTVSPGASAGLLTHDGDYTQDGAGSLTIEIGGATVGTGYDQLAVTGAAFLDGTLDVTTINGFVPVAGDSFRVVTYGSGSGDFATINGLDLGSGRYLVPIIKSNEYILVAEQDPDNVSPIDPGICITQASPCLTVDFEYTRTNVSQVRGYSVTFSIQGGLELCDGMNSINEGTYLSGFCGGGCTAIQKADNGGGSYTFDATILGSNCGPAVGGTLFTVDVTDAAGDGSGSIVVTEVLVRDCSNQPIPAFPGAPISIDIDLSTPPTLDLTVAQLKSGNDTDGTTAIQVDLAGIEVDATVEVFRKGFGGYPEYATGSVPTIPATPAAALSEGWTLTGLTSASGVDEPLARDFYYYVGFQTSPCGVLTPASAMTGGTLNYHLGDTSDGITQGQGDNAVETADLSLLGANYLSTSVGSVPFLDFGPTETFSIDARPVPDGAINFEELILIGINFSEVSLTEPEVTAVDIDVRKPLGLRLVSTSAPAAGVMPVPSNELVTRLVLEGNRGDVKGLHSEIRFDSNRLELLSVAEGSLLGRQHQVVFTKDVAIEGGLVFDSAVIGRGQTYRGSGEVAVLRFRVLTPGARPTLAAADLRGPRNERLLEGTARTANSPESLEPAASRDESIARETQIVGARPNPFSAHTDIVFRLAEETSVSIVVHDVSGRQVRALRNERLAAGEHQIAWDGRNDSGRALPAGVYWYTIQAGTVTETQKLFIAR